MDEQAQALAPEEQMLNLLGGEEEIETEQDDREEVDPESVESDEVEEEQEPAVEYFDLTVNGEQVKVTKEEAIALAQQGKDYTQKTQRLAEERRHIEAQIAAAKQQMDLQAAIVDKIAEAKAMEGQLKQYEQVDWQALIQADPTQAMMLDRQYRDLRDMLNGKYQEVQHAQGEVQKSMMAQRQEMLVREHQSLMAAIPEWNDAAKAGVERSQLRDYLLNSGFNPAEVDGLADHKAVVVARKAMLYDALMAKKPQVENKVANAPKPVKPGAAQQRNPKTEKVNKLKGELKRTGRSDYAVAALEALL